MLWLLQLSLLSLLSLFLLLSFSSSPVVVVVVFVAASSPQAPIPKSKEALCQRMSSLAVRSSVLARASACPNI